ncbi:hypothetical protein ACIRF8_08985 [Streptomyces sp. NPDC102406]|uniref:hypothetical protein n=1 Tax=Streptomyces sp. NPDC102406 TaxID=3366171 RepID=UPI0038029D41
MDIDSALRILFQGPTAAEGAKKMTTQVAAAPATALTGQPVEVPGEPLPAAPVKVTVRQDRVTVELSRRAGKATRLAAWQIICTTGAAQRLATPGAQPAPVTVVTADGRRYAGDPTRCPDG